MTAPATAVGYLASKAQRIRAERRVRAPAGAALEALRERAVATPTPPRFAAPLRARGCVAVIAEYKRRSPSGGTLAGRATAHEIATAYAAAGAAALSVLTDAEDFGGTFDDLADAAVAARLPVLCKDFIVDEARLVEARAAGAAAALLIARLLEAQELVALLGAASTLGLECLVEVHDEHELAAAVAAGATLIGINNRDLATLTTDLRVTERLARRAPASVTLVSESGIRTADDAARVAGAGAHAVLVGEALLRVDHGERTRLLRALATVPR